MKAEQKCKNCGHFMEFPDGAEECALSGFNTGPDDVCNKYDPFFVKVCGICGAETNGDDDEVIKCSENPLHMLSLWDGEWYDYELQKGVSK